MKEVLYHFLKNPQEKGLGGLLGSVFGEIFFN